MSADLRIGSLCTGYGGLDMAVQEVLGGTLTWVADPDPGAAAILAHHWPAVPNLGDITAVDWSAVPPVDVLCAGFPCQDISYAGRGEGIQGDVILPAGELECGCQWADHKWKTCRDINLPMGSDTSQYRQAVAELNQFDRADPAGSPPERVIQRRNHSGLWHTIADAIGVLRPRIVVLENVAAIVGRRPGLDVVLADLARLGFDAEWCCVRASDVGAAHQRNRWFCRARPAADPASDGRDEGRTEPAGIVGGPDAAFCGGAPAADADSVGRHGPASELGAHGRPESPAGAPTDTEGERHGDGRPPSVGGLATAAFGGAPADPDRDAVREQPVAEPGDGGPAVAGRGCAPAADAPSLSHPHGPQRDSGQLVVAQPGPDDGTHQRAAAKGAGRPDDDPTVLAWGAYEPAIRRWERTLGRPAPAPRLPTGRDGRDQLSPAFVEWLMGLPEGWVTDLYALNADPRPNMISRNAALKALGNGVVPLQAAHALRLLFGAAA